MWALESDPGGRKGTGDEGSEARGVEPTTPEEESPMSASRWGKGWHGTLNFYMAVTSFGLGLGTVWRFTNLLCTHGNAFIVAYVCLAGLMGTPIFSLEVLLGQFFQCGPLLMWKSAAPALRGIGIAGILISYSVATYYNVLVGYIISYLASSIHDPLPWTNCTTAVATSEVNISECEISASPSSFYFYRMTLDTASSIEEFGNPSMHLTHCILTAWALVFVGSLCGAKIMQRTLCVAVMVPLCVLFLFLFTSLPMAGSREGLLLLTNIDFSSLLKPSLWFDAAAQVCYSLGIGFGGIVAFGSKNSRRRRCLTDGVILTAMNTLCSLLTAVTVFVLLGVTHNDEVQSCLKEHAHELAVHFPEHFRDASDVFTIFSTSQLEHMTQTAYEDTPFANMSSIPDLPECSLLRLVEESARGPGMAFVVFTQGAIHFPNPRFYTVLFFVMLLLLGLGSMIGTLEGTMAVIEDSKHGHLPRPLLGAFAIAPAMLVNLMLFTQGNGQYWVRMFDSMSGSYSLMTIIFAECLAAYAIGYKRLSSMCAEMHGHPPAFYWFFCWFAISPVIVGFFTVQALYSFFVDRPTFDYYIRETAHIETVPFPGWCVAILCIMVAAIAIVAFFGFVKNVVGKLLAQFEKRKKKKIRIPLDQNESRPHRRKSEVIALHPIPYHRPSVMIYVENPLSNLES